MNKFRQRRREFKRIMNEKMRLNVNDSSDPALISKNFGNMSKQSPSQLEFLRQ